MKYGSDYCKIIIVGAVASDIALNHTHEGVPRLFARARECFLKGISLLTVKV